jgi:hypothetical protein
MTPQLATRISGMVSFFPVYKAVLTWPTVWHGPMSPYQDYKAYTSRFVSEFGFESAPDLRTLHKASTHTSWFS